MILRLLLVLNILCLLISCSKEEPHLHITKQTHLFYMKKVIRLSSPMTFFMQIKNLTKLNFNFENIDLAAKSAVMSIFSLYGINFIQKH